MIETKIDEPILGSLCDQIAELVYSAANTTVIYCRPASYDQIDSDISYMTVNMVVVSYELYYQMLKEDSLYMNGYPSEGPIKFMNYPLAILPRVLGKDNPMKVIVL